MSTSLSDRLEAILTSKEKTMSADRPEIRLTKRDFARLDHLLATRSGAPLSKAADFLLEELSRAKVEAEVPPDTVTMHARILFRDDESGRERTVTLVYPVERQFGEDMLSVLTPLGAALIGLAEGQSIAFEGLDGATRRVTVLKVLRQRDPIGG